MVVIVFAVIVCSKHLKSVLLYENLGRFDLLSEDAAVYVVKLAVCYLKLIF